MRVFCSICKDVFLPYSDVQVTNCGHLYHTLCISTWIKQHRTCPQCRAKLSQPIKIYFDVEKDSELDLSVLEHQVETLSDKLRESEKNIKSLKEEKENYVRIAQDIEDNNEKLKNKSRVLKGSIKALKEQVTNLTKQNESLSLLKREVTELKSKVTTLEKIEGIIKGSADEVNKMLENTPVTELAVKHLCTYVGILKIQLEKSEAKYVKLDKVLKALTKSIAEEKKKNSVDEDLVKNLKLNISKLELQLFQTRALYRDYKKKHPEKAELDASQKNTSQMGLGFKDGLDIDMELDENQSRQAAVCIKPSKDISRDFHNTEEFMSELDVLMETDENQSTKAADFNKAINHWEELVSAGPSNGLGLHKSKSFIRSSLTSQSIKDVSRTDAYAFDGLGGRKKLRLGGPTPQEEFIQIKRKKTQKLKSAYQHKKIVDVCQIFE